MASDEVLSMMENMPSYVEKYESRYGPTKNDPNCGCFVSYSIPERKSGILVVEIYFDKYVCGADIEETVGEIYCRYMMEGYKNIVFSRLKKRQY